MFEIVFAAILVLMVFFYIKGHPFVKNYYTKTSQRKELAKKHVRLFKARNDLMVSFCNKNNYLK